MMIFDLGLTLSLFLAQVKFYTQHGNWDLVGNNIPV
jgi:Catalase